MKRSTTEIILGALKHRENANCMSKGAKNYTLEPEAQQRTENGSVLSILVDFDRSNARKAALRNSLPYVCCSGHSRGNVWLVVQTKDRLECLELRIWTTYVKLSHGDVRPIALPLMEACCLSNFTSHGPSRMPIAITSHRRIALRAVCYL